MELEFLENLFPGENLILRSRTKFHKNYGIYIRSFKNTKIVCLILERRWILSIRIHIFDKGKIGINCVAWMPWAGFKKGRKERKSKQRCIRFAHKIYEPHFYTIYKQYPLWRILNIKTKVFSHMRGRNMRLNKKKKVNK